MTRIDPDGLNTLEDYYYQQGEGQSQDKIDSLQVEYYSRLVGNRQTEKFTDVNQTLIGNQDFRYQVLADYANNLNENEVSIFDLMKNDPAIYSALQITAVGTAGNIQDLANVIENMRTTFGYGSSGYSTLTGVDFAASIIQDITRPSTQEQALFGMVIVSVFAMPILFEAAPVLTAKLTEISFNAQLRIAQILGIGGFSSPLARGFDKVSSRIANWLGNKLGSNNIGGFTRDGLLKSVNDPKLKNINDLYRPGAQIGSGSTADALRYELQTGNIVGGRSHLEKAMNYSKGLQKLLSKGTLNETDKNIAQTLLDDLINALGGN